MESNNDAVLDLFLNGDDIEDASPGLLHTAISLGSNNSIAKQLISRKYKHLFTKDKVRVYHYFIGRYLFFSVERRDSTVFSFV